MSRSRARERKRANQNSKDAERKDTERDDSARKEDEAVSSSGPDDDGKSSSAPAAGGRSKLRSFLAKALLTLAATVVALVVAEVFLRVAGVAPELRPIALDDADSPYQLSQNPILGYEHKVNYRNDHPDHVVTFGSTNAHGQRDIEREFAKPPGVRRVILLGDSVVESLEVPELDDLMNCQLEKLYTDGKTEVLNFGVNGYCTLAEVELLETKGLKFDPDVVVVVFVKNDFNNMNAAAGATVTGIESLSGDYLDARSPAVGFLVTNSHLFRLAYLALPKAAAPPPDPFAENRRAMGDNNVVQGLERLRRLADEHKFDVAIAIWPTFGVEGITDDAPVPGTGELLIERLAKANGIPSVRLSRYFREQWESLGVSGNPRDYYTIGDQMHVQTTGSRASALVLKRMLDDLAAQDAFAAARSAAATTDPEMAALARRLGANSSNYTFFFAVLDLANTEHEAGRLQEAIKYNRIALELDPDNPIAHAQLGQCYLEAGDYEQAEYHLGKASANP